MATGRLFRRPAVTAQTDKFRMALFFVLFARVSCCSTFCVSVCLCVCVCLCCVHTIVGLYLMNKDVYNVNLIVDYANEADK